MFGNCAKSAPDRISRVTCATNASHLPQSTRRAALPSKEHTTHLRAERLWSSIVCLISADDNAGRGPGWLSGGEGGSRGGGSGQPPSSAASAAFSGEFPPTGRRLPRLYSFAAGRKLNLAAIALRSYIAAGA